jgi:glycosyltransferase involved in cell wall biosynthesis
LNIVKSLISKLPLPPSGKTGWPWSEESTPPPQLMPDGKLWPKISIVTPSFNQGQYLEETIRSVLLQNYPNLEYIIMDGGSTDNSVEIIKKYEPWLTYWVSDKDNGQAHALNEGFRRASGDVIAWQNSDDYYCKDAFQHIGKAIIAEPNYDVYYGTSFFMDNNREVLNTVFSNNSDFLTPRNMFPDFNFSNQSLFLKRKLFQTGISFKEQFRNAFDIALYVDLVLAGARFYPVQNAAGVWRIYDEIKSVSQYSTTRREFLQIYHDILGSRMLHEELRNASLRSFRQYTIGCFRDGEMQLFRENVVKLIRFGSLRMLDRKLVARYLISLLGSVPYRYFVNKLRRSAAQTH